jgi:hypothetical protein
MDQNEAQYFIQLLTRVKVNLPEYPNKALKEELENVIKKLRGS